MPSKSSGGKDIFKELHVKFVSFAQLIILIVPKRQFPFSRENPEFRK